MEAAQITELRLTAFKSFQDAVLPLSDVTVLTGRNSAGKSNALDGLEVLARLAGGEDLSDALDGRRREDGAVRGGSAGCAPHGTDRFDLGCTVRVGTDLYHYDVGVEVAPDLRVVHERLVGPGTSLEKGKVTPDSVLVETRPPAAGGAGIGAGIYSGKRGPNEAITFRDSRLVLTQVPLAVSGANRTERSVLRGAEAVVRALRGSFHLDPVPHLMRSYVPERDTGLRRTGENLSAALRHLSRTDAASFDRIIALIKQVADERVTGVEFVASDLGDVMLALIEDRGGKKPERTPAREMSDGLMRFIAVATALLSSQHGLDVDRTVGAVRGDDEDTGPAGGVLIVIEELENGLHPSQAARVLELIRSAAEIPGTSVLVTTHSPALLDAVEGTLNNHVVVCHRDAESGRSRLTRLVDLPGYARALAEGTLGDAVTAGKLVDDAVQETDYSEFARLVGLS